MSTSREGFQAIADEERMQKAMRKAHERTGNVVLDEWTTESGVTVRLVPFVPIIEEDME